MPELLKKPEDRLFFILVTLLVLLVYQQALWVSFLSDDFSIIGKILERKIPDLSFSGFFRPLPLVNLWLDTQLFGLRSALFRLENLLLHSVNALLVYRLALLMQTNNGARENKTRAYLSAILFAVLPCHSEAVIWIACRPDLLATCFSLICLICYLTWLRSGKKMSLYIAALTFFFAFLSKESAYALPVILVVITCFHESPLTIARNIKKYYFAALLFAIGLLTQFVLRYMATQELFGGAENIFISLNAYAYTFFSYSYRTLLFPTSSATDALRITDHAVLISIIVTSIVCVALRMTDARSRKMAIFMLFAFVAALTPVMHKGPMSLYELQIERYLYLPSVFICILIPLLLSAIPFRRVQYVIFFIYALCLVFFLNLSTQRWNKASDIAIHSLREVKNNFHAEKLMVMGLPVSYQGVHIFKNGFPRAVMFFNQTPIRRKNIYLPVNLELNENNLKIDLVKTETAFQVSINSAVSKLLPGEDIGAYDLVSDHENTVTVHYTDINNNDYQVMVFEDGKLTFR
jgi:hypothetical protein